MTPRAIRPHAHGTSLHYAKLGCTDPACVALATADRRARRDRRKAERVLDEHGNLVHPNAPHGTSNGYVNYFCRCPPCSTVGADASRAARRNRKTRKRRTR